MEPLVLIGVFGDSTQGPWNGTLTPVLEDSPPFILILTPFYSGFLGTHFFGGVSSRGTKTQFH